MSDPRVGQVVLDRYRITRSIADGGMGSVYEAEHVRIGRRFAVKFMRTDLADDKKVLARFEQEAITAGALETENICAIVDAGAAPDGARVWSWNAWRGRAWPRCSRREACSRFRVRSASCARYAA
jgi:serine/threonine-protein kinase